MAKLIVQFPGKAEVNLNGVTKGETNRVISLDPGEYIVSLKDKPTEPEQHVVKITAGANGDTEEIVRIGFNIRTTPIDRFSPLYCRYNGFLLGQFLSLSFANYGRDQYSIRRARMMEFLAEINVNIQLPEESPGLGSDTHNELLMKVLSKTLDRSAELTDFVLLGSLLLFHGLLHDQDPATAAESRVEVQRIRLKYDLPVIDEKRFVTKGNTENVDSVLSPSLAYLSEIVEKLEAEEETAFVIMPFKQPYASYFEPFYSASLASAGYRAFRAWGGLSNEDYCDLLLKLIKKVGFIWADVSELNYNVLYEIGAAHAFDKLSMLIVQEAYADSIPANIGHDAIIRYSSTDQDWPDGTVLLMAAMISALKMAATQGKRLRIGAGRVAESLQQVGAVLQEILMPEEAKEAAASGEEKFTAEDYSGAEQCFNRAIKQGLDDELTMLRHGMSLVFLERYPEAEADFTKILEPIENIEETKAYRMTAYFFRAMAREFQENYEGARPDYENAIKLGYTDVQVYLRLASVHIQLGDLKNAQRDIEKAKVLAPEDAEVFAVQGDLMTAEKLYEQAIKEYNRALEVQPSPRFVFSKALTLLLAEHPEDAAKEYRTGLQTASEEEVQSALKDLQQSAKNSIGFEQCQAILRNK